MNHRTLLRSLGTCLLLIVFSVPALARGTISGRVIDRGGNPVVGVQVVVGPESDPDLRNYKMKTGSKGDFLAMVSNGAYKVTMDDETYAVEQATIRAENSKHEEIFNWGGKVLAGTPMPAIEMESGYKVTVDLYVSQKDVLLREQTNTLLSSIVSALDRGDREEATKTIDDLLASSPDHPVGLTLRAYMLAQDGKFDEAERDLKHALEQEPTMFDAQYQLASIYSRTGRTDEAHAAYAHAEELAQDDEQTAKVWLSLGELERDAGNTEKAIEHFEKAVEKLPAIKATVVPEIVALYTAMGDTEKAEQWLAQESTEDVADPVLQYNVGVLHFNNKEWEQAVAAFDNVIAADPDFADAHRNLGYCLLNLGRQQDALVHFQKFLELAPDAPEAQEVQMLVGALSKMKQ